jgi:hypothetical protein
VVNQQRAHQKGPTLRTSRTNYTTVEEILTGEEVLAGTFFLNERPIIILFNSGASHDFISSTCAKKAMLSMVAMEAPYVISTPGGRVDVDRIVRKAPTRVGQESVQYQSHYTKGPRTRCHLRNELDESYIGQSWT